MATLKQLKEAAEVKNLRYEIHVIHDFGDWKKMEIGINYKSWIWAWFSFIQTGEVNPENEYCIFRQTYNQATGAQDKSYRRGVSVVNQLTD